jgi:hypothetical protein
MSNLSSDIVSEGAFFPQSDPHVPEKEVSQHAREHVMAPPRIFSHLVMIPAQLCFGFLEALFNGPPDAAQPNKGFQAGAHRCIAEIERIRAASRNSPLDDQPDCFDWQSVLAQDYPSFRELVLDRTFRSL